MRIKFNLYKDGKKRAFTMSYDDGQIHDLRLIEIFNKYGVKGTFNLNANNIDKPGYVTSEDVRTKYVGHEVACHGFTHQYFERIPREELIREVLEDRKNIEADYGVITRGMAYAYGDYSAEAIEILKQCGIVYSRTVYSTLGFGFPQNWLTLHPTCHHNNEKLMELAERFVTTTPRFPAQNMLFYVWGHSYEFDDNDNWDVIERFAEYVGGKNDIWYATNIEIHDYVRAYEALVVNADSTLVYNPTLIDVWFSEKGKTYCAHAGETVHI